MKISKLPPPNYAQMLEAFPDIPKFKPVFCWQDTIHDPFGINPLPDIIAHEEVHCHQQGNLPEIWYSKYIHDPAFRLSQEIEAYGVQYNFIKQHMKGKLLRYGLEMMAEALSGELYGNLITYGEAISKIRSFVV